MSITKKQAKRNLKIFWWINFLAWVTFLVPIISIFYKYTWLSTAQIILVSNIFTLWMRVFELPTSTFADTVWKKKSLMASVICNFICATLIAVFPNLIWFCIAAVFQSLYHSFWSGTWQVYLEENLTVLWDQKKFWRFFWKFSSYEDLAALFTPVIASFILKWQPESGYTILAVLDAISALWLIILTSQLTETTKIVEKFKSFKESIKTNIDTWISAVKSVFWDKDLKLYLIYNCLSHHAKFFAILLLPILADKWMPNWLSWLITTVFTLFSMLAWRNVWRWWEKYWYNTSIVWSTVVQWILLIIAWIFFKSWIFLAVLYLIFYIFDGFVYTSRNHGIVLLTDWKAKSTCRSIIFACIWLYMTIAKFLLSYFEPNIALVILWAVILSANLIFAKKILRNKRMSN